MKFKSVFAILLLFALLATSLIAAPASSQAAQSCVKRTDWSTYRVVPGDTLFKIAVRFHVTTSELAAANCITNINLIYYGQLMRVPGAGGVVTGTFDIPTTYQQFENGFMIWRTDTGDIWVYSGLTRGSVTHYLSQSYGNLPTNPILTIPPTGRLTPIFGFGKVWGNFSRVRTALGWATTPESSHIMRYLPVTPNQFYFSLPDGRYVVNNSNQTWSIYTGTLPTPPSGTSTVTTAAAYQLFENGFLLWRMDTGRIDLFTKDYVAGYNLDQYATLPNNPVTTTPPAGRVSPINGFGRVWGNFVETRNQLGWGLGTEQGFQATFKTNVATNVTCVNLPDGKFISYAHFVQPRSWVWQYETSCS